ncbi:hypothetical protein EMIT093MI4_80182 [Pseudomonas sp. IT-93MI4]
MWVRASGLSERAVILFDYTTSRAREALLRLLSDYRDDVTIDYCAGYNVLALQPSLDCLGCMAPVGRKFVDSQKPGIRARAGVRYRPESDQQSAGYRARSERSQR